MPNANTRGPFSFEGPLDSVDVPAGASAGAAVTVYQTFAYTQRSPYYGVLIECNQPGVIASVSDKTANGFTVTLTPLPTVTVAAVGFTWWLFWGYFSNPRA
jgi:hypothetical protein